MRKLCAFAMLIFVLSGTVNAQTTSSAKLDSIKAKLPSNDQTEKFRKNDSAYKSLEAKKTLEQFKNDSTDLKLTSCSFEKDANAMVISDMANFAFGNGRIIEERYRRIKIFNDNGKSEANIRIEYNNRYGAEHILAVVAETINFNNGKIEHTRLDSSLVYNVHTDKQKDAIVFTMPNVKAGSVITYAYVWAREASINFPDWDFQCDLPTAYSEVNVLLNPQLVFTLLTSINQPFVRDTVSYGGYGHIWAMKNIPSAKNEPYMRSAADGLQRVSLILQGIHDFFGKTQNLSDSWATVGKRVTDDKIFSKPYDQNLSDDGDLVTKAKTLKTDDEKIEFLFNQVKTQMKWNGEKNWISKDGIKSAWKKKSGNWSEVNMVLYHFLKKCGIKAYPMLVSTRNNGMLYANFPNIFQVDKLVAYVPVDSTTYYVLDASDKYNLYNEVPYELLNSCGLSLDKEKEKYNIVLMQENAPVRESLLINAEITPDGNMKGNATIDGYGYNKSGSLELYKTLEEKEYKQYLTDGDNNIKITSLKLENSEIDSLPLTQNIEFNLNLAANDDQYIYFNPNIFTNLHKNPFISENRTTNIDFGYKNHITISGKFKIPAGYKIDYLPPNMNIVTQDKDISFKRLMEQDDGYISVYYVINYKKAVYLVADYPNLYAYFKKMYEMLNEQVVLKKT